MRRYSYAFWLIFSHEAVLAPFTGHVIMQHYVGSSGILAPTRSGGSIPATNGGELHYNGIPVVS